MNASSVSERAISLLGAGVPQEIVASALGVTPGYISQLLSDENFAAEVTQRKFLALTAHNARDKEYNEVEDALLVKLKKSLPLIIRPETILGAIKVINGAARRGHDSIHGIVEQQNIVSILMPVQLVQQFTTNIHNQVIKTGDRDLLTIQSSELLKRTEQTTKPLQISHTQISNDATSIEPTVFEDNKILASL